MAVVFFNGTATTEIYTLSLHDALPILGRGGGEPVAEVLRRVPHRLALEHAAEEIAVRPQRSEEHTSELQSRGHLVCRLLLEKKKPRKLTIRSTEATSNGKTRTGERTGH